MTFKPGHALIIGVGEYCHHPGANVPIVAQDAIAVREVLVDTTHCGYPADQVTLLRNQAASRQDVLSALKALAGKLDENATLFLFYAGHGGYGTDGNYYLTSHDTQVENSKVKAGTGISEGELIDGLRKIKAKRLLLVINACHSGAVSPDLDLGGVPAFSVVNPPEKLTSAILSTGEGRIIITACRPEQSSYIGSGPLTIFSQAVVNGLKGDGMFMQPRGGYISAYNLYEQVYFSAKEAAAKLDHVQEPELTVLRGVGPFPVALYKGATDLGTFDMKEALPSDTAAREVEPATSQRVLDRSYKVSIAGNVTITGGDFVGRDKNIVVDSAQKKK